MLSMNYSLINLSSSPLLYTLIIFSFLNYMNNFSWSISKMNMLMIMIFMLFFMMIFFFNMMVNENLFMGIYSSKKKNFLSNGFILFILSELMVFMSLFWSYIHNAFAPNIYMGSYWPPKGILSANPTSMIIFGTAILLSSSLIIMVSHNNFIMKNFKLKSMVYFFFCMFMGTVFIDMQILEMTNFMMKLNFNFNDSIFSSAFLFTTSLHASHVLLGMIGLLYSFYMMMKNYNNMIYYMNFEMSIWYWHFVDYIWIGVFTLFYYFNN